MLNTRLRLSLSQYLALQGRDWLKFLFRKHGVSTPDYAEPDAGPLQHVEEVERWIQEGDPVRVEGLLSEVIATQGDLRYRASPKYVHDQRYADLVACLELEGYRIERGAIHRMEPDLDGTYAVEDDLTTELRRSNLAEAEDIIQCLNMSADNFRRTPPDFNGSLTNARVALQTLVTAISRVNSASRSGGFDETKWGQVLAHLRTSGVVTDEEEKGIGGVFTFVSPGAHTRIGLSEAEAVRLGRSLVVSMCYFLGKRYNA